MNIEKYTRNCQAWEKFIQTHYGSSIVIVSSEVGAEQALLQLMLEITSL